MSRFTGTPEDRWSLHAMLEQLGEAARRAARPGWIWIAGFLYPTIALLPGGLSLNVFSTDTFDGTASVHFGAGTESTIGLGIAAVFSIAFLLVFTAPFFRLDAGLVRLAPRAVWDRVGGDRGRPGLRDCWRAGKGLTFSVLGMFVSVGLLRYALLLLMLIPAGFAWKVMESLSAQGAGTILLAVLALPALAVLLIYNLLLSLLQQLALHSLVHNRRGVASALQHAWSILRRDPWAGARALTGEVLLALIFLAVQGLAALLQLGASASAGSLIALFALALTLFVWLLQGIFGVTRACYWASAYRALGGLSPDDGVPGLEEVFVAPPQDLRGA
ncbi:MAG: hypothetical protein KDC14_17915 [Planctomycetes bacterium]|nr:hypothetical protein [Planctomycetota bacterium]